MRPIVPDQGMLVDVLIRRVRTENMNIHGAKTPYDRGIGSFEPARNLGWPGDAESPEIVI